MPTIDPGAPTHISVDQARANVDDRLSRIVESGDAVVNLDVVKFTCVGTDVRAPELQREIMLCAQEFALKVGRDGADPIDCLNGAVLRTFWLGYEYGKAAD